MEILIREGKLRLHTTESSCDVILSCQGDKLMAHKVILSIASPVLRDLLLQDYSEPTVIILPDINRSTISLILDYIYSGSVIVHANNLNEFLSAAELLKLQLGDGSFKIHKNLNESLINDMSKSNYKSEQKQKFGTEEVLKSQEKSEQLNVVSPNSPEVYSKTTQRKIPNLVPITALSEKRVKANKNFNNCVIPSPWCPRLSSVLVDPRNDYLDNMMCHKRLRDNETNDSNNNFRMPLPPLSRLYADSLCDSLTNYYPKVQSTRPKTYQSSIAKYDRTVKEQASEKPHERLFINSSSEKPVVAANNEIGDSSSKTDFSNVICSKQTSTQRCRQSINLSDDRNIILQSSEYMKSPNGEHEKDILPANDNNDESCNETLIKNEVIEDEVVSITWERNKVEQKGDKQKQFKCEDCGKCFSQLRNYKYHRSVHEGTKEFAAKCHECGKVFNDRGYLSSHMKIHRDRKEYACPHCPKRFNQRVAYNMHLRIHTGIKPHECSTCGKSFSRKMLLKQHQRVHTGERPYSCPECGKTFADRSNMSLHARLHTGVKPYACSLCPKSFTKKHHLKTHMNFHTGLKPYTCQKCGLAFSQSSNMRTHYKKCILKNNTASPATSTTTLLNEPKL